MGNRVNYTFVGFFVVVLTAAIVLGIIWLSAGLSVAHTSTYLVYMRESVTGLNVDSAVEYSGVNVGSVKSITLYKKNPKYVELELEIDDRTPITRSTAAKLNTRGLTGITFVALESIGNDSRPLRAAKGQEYPVIRTVPSLFLRLDTALNKLTESLTQTSQSLATLLNPQNQRQIQQILVNFNTLTTTMANQSQKLNLIMTNTARASEQFVPFMQTSESAMQLFSTQTLPATNRMLSSLDTVMRNLAQVSLELKQNPAVLIRGKGQQPLGPGE